MGQQPPIAAIQYAEAPSRKAARRLLYEIAKKQVSFKPRKVDKPLILYGAGNLGRMAKEYFERLGVPFMFVVDANPDVHRRDPFWAGTDILGLHDVGVKNRESALLAVCIATVPFLQMNAPLTKQGWRDVVPFYDIAEAYRDRHPLSNGWHGGSLSEGDIGGIESVLCRWEDDISLAHHLQFVAWRCLREEWSFGNAPVMTTHDRYFIPQVLSALHDHEVFVDVGAHHGQVSIQFLDMAKQRYKGIFAIEPDGENFSVLRGRLEEHRSEGKRNIHLLDCALGATGHVKRFYHGLGYASQFSELGQTDVEVRSLDDFSIPATFVKIHVEGWEPYILSGAVETIMNNRPILTVTSYHNREGLWQLPTQIMSGLDNYAYYFRLHSWCGTGAVIYAIPRERIRESPP